MIHWCALLIYFISHSETLSPRVGSIMLMKGFEWAGLYIIKGVCPSSRICWSSQVGIIYDSENVGYETDKGLACDGNSESFRKKYNEV